MNPKRFCVHGIAEDRMCLTCPTWRRMWDGTAPVLSPAAVKGSGMSISITVEDAPTPEADAEFAHFPENGRTVCARIERAWGFARRLERERDEAHEFIRKEYGPLLSREQEAREQLTILRRPASLNETAKASREIEHAITALTNDDGEYLGPDNARKILNKLALSVYAARK